MEVSFVGLAGWVSTGIAAGLLSGLADANGICLRGRIPAAAASLDVVAGARRPGCRHRRAGRSGALGVGYTNIATLLDGRMIATAAFDAAGGEGRHLGGGAGVGHLGRRGLAPLLIMGGAMGAVLAGFCPAADPGFWALLAMAATMGGTMRAPLTATFFAVELTGNRMSWCR